MAGAGNAMAAGSAVLERYGRSYVATAILRCTALLPHSIPQWVIRPEKAGVPSGTAETPISGCDLLAWLLNS